MDNYFLGFRSACAEENIKVLNEDNFNDFNDANVEYEDFVKACKEDNIDINKILVCYGMPTMNNVYYHPSDGIYEPIMLDPHFFSTFKINKRVKILKKKIAEYYSDKDWDLYFAFIPDTFKIIEYERISKDLNKEEKFKCFKPAYTKLDRSLGLWKKETIDEILSIGKSFNNINNNNIITIYRGESNKSLSPIDALSWTTSKKVAKSFANRGINYGVIHEATVYEKDIVIIDGTGEEEVLVKYDDLLTIDGLILK